MRFLLGVMGALTLMQGCDNSPFTSGALGAGADSSGGARAGSGAAGDDAGRSPSEGGAPSSGAGDAGHGALSPQAGQGHEGGDGGAVSVGGASTQAGDGGASTDGGDGGASQSDGGEPSAPRSCSTRAQCQRGENCIDEWCVPALPTCAAQKNHYPASHDGLYWIGKIDDVRLVYCDMDEAVELCSETAAEHRGRTRDSSKIPYVMTSLLLPNQGLCKLWAIRAVSDGHPLGPLEGVGGLAGGQTCSKLGFASDGTIGSCSFGSERSSCGFSGTFFRYGNHCSGCDTGAGVFDHYVLQGPLANGSALSTFSGSTFSTCKTGP